MVIKTTPLAKINYKLEKNFDSSAILAPKPLFFEKIIAGADKIVTTKPALPVKAEVNALKTSAKPKPKGGGPIFATVFAFQDGIFAFRGWVQHSQNMSFEIWKANLKYETSPHKRKEFVDNITKNISREVPKKYDSSLMGSGMLAGIQVYNKFVIRKNTLNKYFEAIDDSPATDFSDKIGNAYLKAKEICSTQVCETGSVEQRVLQQAENMKSAAENFKGTPLLKYLTDTYASGAYQKKLVDDNYNEAYEGYWQVIKSH